MGHHYAVLLFFLVWIGILGLNPLRAQGTDGKQFPVLRGPYLGQSPPGHNPEMFAPGIISTGKDEGCTVFFAEGKRLIFRRGGDPPPNVYMTEQIDGQWTQPKILPFQGQYEMFDFTAAPGGDTLYFTYKRPPTGSGPGLAGGDLWKVGITPGGFSEPISLGPVFNSEAHESYPCVTRQGDLYFFRRLNKGDPMKREIVLFCCLLIIEGLGGNRILLPRETEHAGPVLSGAYLGQKEPGMTPEVFAPGIVSAGKNELNAAFSPDQGELFFSVKTPAGDYVIMHMKQGKGSWTKPQVAWYSGKYSDVDPSFSPDGMRLFFSSHRPGPGTDQPGEMDIWIMDRLESGWSHPYHAGVVINSPEGEVHAVLTRGQVLYYASGRAGGKGEKDLYRSRYIKGVFTSPENLGEVINTPYGDSDCYISPAEDFLIFCSDRPGGYGKVDLYISFRQGNGAWGNPRNMGKDINTPEVEYAPVVSPEGKFLFFARKGAAQPGGGDVYWVDAAVIEKLR